MYFTSMMTNDSIYFAYGNKFFNLILCSFFNIAWREYSSNKQEKMFKYGDISVQTYRVLIYNNVLTCLYLPLMILVLSYTGNLYSFGTNRTYNELFLALAEIMKYIRYHKSLKSAKQKFTIGSFLKSLFTCGIIIVIFHVGAILFGAPFLLDQYKTLFFATLLMVLTTLPICLHLDSDNVYTLFSSMLYFEGNKLQEHFLINIRFTLFGAWLGAVVIPLDWNRPYQDWPIPCYYGAICGYFVGNLISILHYFKYGESTTQSPIISEITGMSSKELTTVIIFVISAVLAITLLFMMAIFIDCRQQKLQKLQFKPRRKLLKFKLPISVTLHPTRREDLNSILDKIEYESPSTSTGNIA